MAFKALKEITGQRARVPLPPTYSSWFKNREKEKERNLEET